MLLAAHWVEMTEAKKHAERDRVVGVIKGFPDNTTIHGLYRLAHSTSYPFRIFWTVAFVAAVTGFIIQFSNILHKYNAHTTKTTMEVIREPINFPDVTICPLRNLDIAIIKSLFDQSMGDTPVERHPYNILARNMTKSNPEFEEAYFNTIAPFYHLYSAFFETHPDLFGLLLSRSNLLPNMDMPTLQTAMIPTWELLLYCRWQGKPCNPDYIKTNFDPYFLRCVTFQPPDDTVLSEGVESGLTVAGIYGSGMVDWEEYLRNLSFPVLIAGLQEFSHPLSGNQGARVVLHRRGSPALPSAEGLDIPPGFSGSIGVSFQRTINLGEPFGKCSKVDPRGGANETYRLLPCLRRCIQAQVIKACGCIDTRLPEPAEFTGADRMPYCGKLVSVSENCSYQENPRPSIECLEPLQTVHDKVKCGKTVQAEMEKKNGLMDECNCYTPCDGVKYTKQYSLSGFPPGPEMDSVYVELMSAFENTLRASNPSKMKLELYLKHFGFPNRFNGLKDITKINVHVADTAVVKTMQKRDYTSGDLLSDIGGNLGLFVGMSLLSLGEILQLLWDIAHTMIRTFQQTPPKKVMTPVKVATGSTPAVDSS